MLHTKSLFLPTTIPLTWKLKLYHLATLGYSCQWINKAKNGMITVAEVINSDLQEMSSSYYAMGVRRKILGEPLGYLLVFPRPRLKPNRNFNNSVQGGLSEAQTFQEWNSKNRPETTTNWEKKIQNREGKKVVINTRYNHKAITI